MLTMTRLTKQTKVLDALLPGNAKDRDKKNDSYTSLGGNLNLNDTEKGLGKSKYIPDLWWQLGLKPSLCSKSSLGLPPLPRRHSLWMTPNPDHTDPKNRMSGETCFFDPYF